MINALPRDTGYRPKIAGPSRLSHGRVWLTLDPFRNPLEITVLELPEPEAFEEILIDTEIKRAFKEICCAVARGLTDAIPVMPVVTDANGMKARCMLLLKPGDAC